MTTPNDGEAETRAGARITWVGGYVNAGLSLAKFGAGTIGHSQALIADAAHSLSDLLTDAVTLVGLRLGRRGPDADHHFGHARIETTLAGGVGLILLGAAVAIGYNAGLSIDSHADVQPTWIAVGGALLSVFVKELLYRYTIRIGRKIRSQVVIANAWHHRSDALSSVAALVGVVAAVINPAWHVLDAYAALLVAVLIFGVGLRVLRDVISEVSDRAPPQAEIDRLHGEVSAVDGVISAHDLKVRTSGGLYMMQVHIYVNGSMTVHDGHAIGEAVERKLLAVDGVGEVIVHVDPA